MTTWNSWFEKNLACNTQTYEVGIRTQHKPTSADTGLKLQQIPGRCIFFWGVFLLTWMYLLFFKWHVGTQYTVFMNSTVGGRNPAITSWGNGSWNPLIYRGFKNIPGGDRRLLPATVPQTPGFEILNHICISGYLGSVFVGLLEFSWKGWWWHRNFAERCGGIYQVGIGDDSRCLGRCKMISMLIFYYRIYIYIYMKQN